MILEGDGFLSSCVDRFGAGLARALDAEDDAEAETEEADDFFVVDFSAAGLCLVDDGVDALDGGENESEV